MATEESENEFRNESDWLKLTRTANQIFPRRNSGSSDIKAACILNLKNKLTSKKWDSQ